jgi:hypothetical protein
VGIQRDLVVVVGAGASFDCSGILELCDTTRQPPLVSGLFGSDYADVLNEYRLARAAAAEIRPALLAGESIEDLLRERLRDSTSQYALRRYHQVPLYLQHLLWVAGNLEGDGYTRDPQNYNFLVNHALEFDQPVFVSLNYDTLLDECLAQYSQGYSDVSSYLRPDWALIKLHGSVNWGWELVPPSPAFYATPPPVSTLTALFDGRSPDPKVGIAVRGGDLSTIRYDADRGSATRGSLFYPALSVPVGEQDELVCPDEHVDYLKTRLTNSSGGVDVVTIGYSGRDQEVLAIFEECKPPLRSLCVVDAKEDVAREVAGKIELRTTRSRGGLATETIHGGGFTLAVVDGTLRNHLRTIG